MKELQAKAKVTQTMTRDGLVVENQADGTVENVSCREAEQDYSTDAEGKAEKILERAEDVKDKHKAKKKAKQAAETAESEDGLHGSAARLELTEEERAAPELQPYIQKAEAKADKLDAARAALPKKRVPVKEKVYDAANGKAKSTLRFEQQDKGPPSLKPNPASRPLSEALLFAHGKIHEVEHENVGVEGGHKGEELVEHQTAKAIRSGIRHHKMKPYKAVEKAERQLMSANAEYFYQKSLRDNPQIAQSASNPISRMWQKQRIKQQYAKAARQAGQAAAQGAATTAENGFRVTKLAAEGGERVAEFAARNWKPILIVAVFGLLALLLITGLQSCTVMAGTAGTGVTASSYFSKDKDMLGAEKAYAKLEQKLQRYLDTYEATHNYDEYHFYLDEIEHDPYVLISILSALHDGVFTLAEVQGELEMLFEKQYILTETVTMRPATKWNGSTITHLLYQQEYCGDVLNFKTYSKSYKNKKRIHNDPENWVVFQNVHEPIIERAVFEQVQQKRGKMRKRRTSNGEHNMFSGLLVCADCGCNLHFHFNQGNPEIRYFNCSNYKGNRGTCQSTHYIRVDFLEEVVLGEIRRLTKFASLYEDDFLKAVIGHSQQADEADRKLKEKELKTLLARDEELDGLFERIYEDNVSGKISDERFSRMSRRYEDEQKELTEKIKQLRSEIEKQSSRTMTTDMFISLVRKYTRAKKLTPRMLNELVEKIEVFDAEKVNGVWEQRLRIHYNCVGTIEIPSALPLPTPDVSVNTRKGVVVNYAPCDVAI